MEKPPVVEHPSYRHRGGDKALTYTPQGQAMGMMIEVSATAPETLEVVLPEGTASFLGFKIRSEHRHRIALNPIWPELLPGKSTILPLKGDGKLRVPYSNLSELRVDTWRLAHEKTATAFEHELSEATDVSKARLHHDILRSREWRGMSVLPEELDNAERAMTSSRNREKERVEAVDYSGTPLAGAACELYFDEGFPEKVRLDAAGKLEITRPVTKLMRERGTIHVSGSVSNDREEFVRITPFGEDIYPGDFHISLQDDRVRLIDSRTGKVLEREQRVQWRIMDNEVKPDPGANGLGFKKSLKTERACGTLVIPANCELGVPLPDAEPWREKADYWELSGTDQAGREVRAEHYLWFFRRSDSVPDMKCRHQEGQAELKVELPHAGTAHVFVGRARRLRHLTLPVQQGLQTLNVPLQPEEEGSLRFTLVLLAQKAGDEPVQTSGELFIPIRRNSLELQLQVPEEDCRPAQEVRITGRVLAGGKPADAEVTLFAVDEGMLSVAPYDYPYPEEFFCRQEARQFILQNKKWFWSRQRSLSPQTCAKVADELKYLVLEDYMPSCMEAINPNVPGQAAGLEPLGWSYCFDHREYLADRVRGFCTRWESRDLLNMRYYARVKRAGVSTAPPAQAQLMYEPQVYGLSPNATIVSEP